ncbi:hypothetical protein LUZ60_001043 [Juncus effusus]|nr:hypothetical protein LUZ60_001043 [Juncus effusus]
MLSTIPPVFMAVKIVARMSSTFSAQLKVASFNGESEAVRAYNRLIHKAYKSSVKEGTATGFGMGTAFMFFFCSYGLAVWYRSKLIVDKGYNGGIIINVLMAVMTGTMSLGEATPCITAFAEGQAAAYRIFEAIKRIPGIDASDAAGIVLDDIKGDIELKNVYFSYPTRSDHLIFDGFSLRVPSGTTMAIVGESGCGKSTVINLVERFYDPQAGEVLIDGIDIKGMMLGWIRQKIALVSQEPLLFAATIKENVSYGKEDATMEEIKRALQLANATTFVNKLPHGVDTMVGERGIQLSGGQKQRIAMQLQGR